MLMDSVHNRFAKRMEQELEDYLFLVITLLDKHGLSEDQIREFLGKYIDLDDFNADWVTEKYDPSEITEEEFNYAIQKHSLGVIDAIGGYSDMVQYADDPSLERHIENFNKHFNQLLHLEAIATGADSHREINSLFPEGKLN